MLLTLTARNHEADGVESFQFQPEDPIGFKAGQYLRYTLNHRDPDNRGVSRFFTNAAAPSEGFIMVCTRLSTPGSSFKRALSALKTGAVVEATGPYGQFVYSDHERPAVFVAGGIGITPFRSILVDLSFRRLEPDITLLYANSTPDITFQQLLDDLSAKQAHLKVIYTVSEPNSEWRGLVGRIDERFIRQHAPLSGGPVFYVSGPKGMVEATTNALEAIGVGADRTKQDFFPGYDS
jgi:ferredoxin-NADP reductase